MSPTCDNLSDKVQKNRRAWWMKPDYKSTHPKTREDYLMLQHAADYVSPVARLDRENVLVKKHCDGSIGEGRLRGLHPVT